MTDRAAAPPPPPLVGAAVLVGVQAAVLLVLAVVEVIHADSRRVALAVTTTLFFVVLAAGLAACAVGLLRVRSWARGPVVAVQLIGVLLAFSFWGGSTTPVALGLLATTVLTLAAVLHPLSLRALAAAEEPS